MSAGTAEAAAWGALEAELSAWQAAGRQARLWWRDDDAVAVTPALDRLRALLVGAGVPLGLATIPATVETELAEYLQGWPHAVVIQHGWSHANHALPGAKKAELTAPRPLAEMSAQLSAGRQRLLTLFRSRFEPVLVPPWNRIPRELAAELPGLGFRGLSTFASPRRQPQPVPGLIEADCDLDLMAWRPPRFAGTVPLVTALVALLQQRRTDKAAALGLLSHHLVMDAACWEFCATLLSRTAGHPAVRWIGPTALFAR